MLSVDLVLRRAVGGPRRLSGVGGRDCVDAHVVGEDALEHGSTFAGLQVEGQLLVHLLGVHGVPGVLEVLGIQVLSREGNQAWASVVREVDENGVLGSGLQHSSVSSVQSGLVSSQDGNEVGRSNSLLLVVNHTPSVDVVASQGASGLVEESAWEGVLLVIGDVIVSHHDYVGGRNSVGNEDLVRVAHVRLVTIVGPTVGSSDQDGPLGSVHSGDQQSG